MTERGLNSARLTPRWCNRQTFLAVVSLKRKSSRKLKILDFQAAAPSRVGEKKNISAGGHHVVHY